MLHFIRYFVKVLCLLPKIILENHTLLLQMVKRNIASRYRGTTFGLIWSVVQPLMMLCIYTFVFSVVFQTRWGTTENVRGSFAIIMFCGMALFNIFSECVNIGCSVIVNNPNFVKKVVFPLEILPVVQVISSTVLGMIWFVLLLLGVLLVFHKLSFLMLLLPLILIPLAMFSLGITFFTASFGVYFRDTQYIVSVLLQILFFMTPIFYPIQAVPEKYHLFLEINPLTLMIGEARKIFLYGEFPDWINIGIIYLISFITLILGFLWFYKTKDGFSDVL